MIRTYLLPYLFEVMTNNILLYINLRLRQIVRILTGIGPFRCLFLLGISTILFYGFTEVKNIWVLPVSYMIILWLYHNNRKDKEFLSLQVHGVKRIFIVEYLLLGLPFIISGVIAANYISLPIIILIAVIMPWTHSVKYRSMVLPLPLLYSGDLMYKRMFRKQAHLYVTLLLLSIMGMLHDNINLCKVCLAAWGVVQGTAYMMSPPKHELSVYNSFGMYQLMLIKSGLINIFATIAPFIVLLLIHDTDIILFCLILFSSTMLYLWNMGMAKFSFETQTVIEIYWLLFSMPLFIVAIMKPIVLIPYLIFNIGLTLSVKKKYKHIWS